MGHYNRIGVVALFIIILVSVVKFSSHTLTDDVKSLLESRVTEIENELENNIELIRSLQQTIKAKDSQGDSYQKELKENKEKIEELNKKLEVSSSTKEVGTSRGTKINDRYHKYYHEFKNPEYIKIVYSADEVDTDLNELIIMTSIGSEEAYGEGRSFKDFLEVIQSMSITTSKTTLGLLIGTKSEYEKIQKTIEELSNKESLDSFFSKIILIQSEFIENLQKINRDDRHKPGFQKERRRAIARARNFLVTNSLTDESYTLCLDSDMIKLPKEMMNIFIESGKDIVTPRINHDMAENYDFNAWSGSREEPNEEESRKLDDNDPEFVYIPKGKSALHMHDFTEESHGNDNSISFSVELDSVGGAVLFLKSEILKQGVLFPPYYAIGTKWYRFEGFDGIETEGLCYQARTIGYKCWGMPNLITKHIVDLN